MRLFNRPPSTSPLDNPVMIAAVAKGAYPELHRPAATNAKHKARARSASRRARASRRRNRYKG